MRRLHLAMKLMKREAKDDGSFAPSGRLSTSHVGLYMEFRSRAVLAREPAKSRRRRDTWVLRE